jgi:hypothetical protein
MSLSKRYASKALCCHSSTAGMDALSALLALVQPPHVRGCVVASIIHLRRCVLQHACASSLYGMLIAAWMGIIR